MSGYTDEIIAQQGILAEGERLIQKPFDPETLLRSVREAIDSDTVSAAAAPSAGTASERGLQVMVIEDDPALKELLRLMLGMDDTIEEIIEAGDTAEALALCRVQRPDLVVTDSMSPASGEASPGEAIRSEFPAVPIISFSGSAQDRPWADIEIPKTDGLDSIIEAVRNVARTVSAGNLE
jgi:CheY-like chemotaxis protein